MPTLPDHERRTKASGIVLIVALLSALSCFIPIIYSIPKESQRVVDDDHSYRKATCHLLQTATSCLVISIVPMGDLFLEWINCCSFFNSLVSVFGIEQRKKRDQAAAFLDTSTVRMNLCERTLFVVGIVCLGGDLSFPAVYLSPLHFALGIGVSGISGVLTRASIISLLCRICPTFTPIRSIGLATLFGVFHVLYVGAQLDPTRKTLHECVVVLFFLILFIGTCIVILSLYDMFKRRPTISTTNGEESGTVNPDMISNIPIGRSGVENDLSEQRFHNVVITLHMFAAYLPGVLQLLWDYFGSHWTADHHSSIIYAQLACGVVVFLLDARVRKIESVTAVFEFLDYKKSYVKYISHELHTPLNAATLGLNMAIIQMNKHKKDHVVDHELIETLSGIRLACNAAVNSLNDFLYCGRVESGILELSLETTPVVDFICEAIHIEELSEQALAKQLALDVLFQVDAAVLVTQPTAVPLRSYDCLSCDRSKMDQVLQKLVNNAIKFSDKGSTITIRAYFCPSIVENSPPTDALSMVTGDDNTRRLRPLTMTESIEKSERSTQMMTEHHSGNNASLMDITRSKRMVDSSQDKGRGREDGRLIHDKDAVNIHDNTSEDALLVDIVESKDIVLNGVSGKSNTASNSVQDISTPNSSSRPCASPSPGPDDLDGYLLVTVTDTGPGVSEERTTQLFRGVTNRHHQHHSDNNTINNTNVNNDVVQRLADGVSGRLSSGFGLFISRCIVDLHEGSMSVCSAGDGHGSTFTLSVPMTRKRTSDKDSDKDKKITTILGDYHGVSFSLFQPSLHSQQQQQQQQQQTSNDNNINHNDVYELVDMKDVFRSRFEGDRDDDHARFGTVNGFNVNTAMSRERGTGGFHANGTRRAYRHYPQHHRHPARRSFTFVKDVVPGAAGADDDANHSGSPSIPPVLDGDDESIEQQPQPTTLPITSHHIQMMQDLRPPPSDGIHKALASSAGSQPHSSYRLLVIDDSNLLCTALLVDGHRCDEAKDASTAMVMINQKLRYRRFHGPAVPDLFFSVNHHSMVDGGGDGISDDDGGDNGDGGDCNDMYDAVIIAARDGPSICKSIRALSAKVAIFGVTNTVFFREDSRLFKANGATSVLVKPFDMAFFMDFLRQMENLVLGRER